MQPTDFFEGCAFHLQVCSFYPLLEKLTGKGKKKRKKGVVQGNSPREEKNCKPASEEGL